MVLMWVLHVMCTLNPFKSFGCETWPDVRTSSRMLLLGTLYTPELRSGSYNIHLRKGASMVERDKMDDILKSVARVP